jgi:hypothetical protein
MLARFSSFEYYFTEEILFSHSDKEEKDKIKVNKMDFTEIQFTVHCT